MNDDVFRPGELCGTYRITKLLGRGGFADVYQAIDLASQQKVALKCLQLRHLTNAQITQRMVAETELLSGLDHPNVIQVEDAGINGGVLWLAMEYISGGTLRERLRRTRGPLPPLVALRYARQVAEGVGAAHGMQVVHRDLKPENIMITDKDEVKVLDLGAAKFFGKELTATGDKGAIGTPLYMAPEQIKGDVVDVRTDVYALGIIVYEMIAGRHPFAQPNGDLPPAFEIGTLHLHAQPKPLTESGVTEHLWRVVERAIAKDPAQRYSSMSEFSSAIRAVWQRLLDDAPLVNGAVAPPVRRAPRYTEPSEVNSANDHHSGVRDISPFIPSRGDADTTLDAEPPLMSSKAGASSARGRGFSRFAELISSRGDVARDDDRVVAGSGRVPRDQPLRAVEAPPPASVEPSPPDAITEDPSTRKITPDVFLTARSAEFSAAPPPPNELSPVTSASLEPIFTAPPSAPSSRRPPSEAEPSHTAAPELIRSPSRARAHTSWKQAILFQSSLVILVASLVSPSEDPVPLTATPALHATSSLERPQIAVDVPSVLPAPILDSPAPELPARDPSSPPSSERPVKARAAVSRRAFPTRAPAPAQKREPPGNACSNKLLIPISDHHACQAASSAVSVEASAAR